MTKWGINLDIVGACRALWFLSALSWQLRRRNTQHVALCRIPWTRPTAITSWIAFSASGPINSRVNLTRVILVAFSRHRRENPRSDRGNPRSSRHNAHFSRFFAKFKLNPRFFFTLLFDVNAAETNSAASLRK
jgi:hypothetical protein